MCLAPWYVKGATAFWYWRAPTVKNPDNNRRKKSSKLGISGNRATINLWGTDASEAKRVKLLVDKQLRIITCFCPTSSFQDAADRPSGINKKVKSDLCIGCFGSATSHRHRCLINNKCEPFPSPSWMRRHTYALLKAHTDICGPPK